MPFPETTLINNIVLPTILLSWLMYGTIAAVLYMVYKQVRHFFE
jgi:hypothetical protein